MTDPILTRAEEPKPTVPEVLPLAKAYYALPGNACGGSLHCVLDDGNVSDADVDFCIQSAVDSGDVEGERLGRLLRRMSRTQRGKISNLIYSHDD